MCDASKAQSELAHKAYYYKLLGKKKESKGEEEKPFILQSLCARIPK